MFVSKMKQVGEKFSKAPLIHVFLRHTRDISLVGTCDREPFHLREHLIQLLVLVKLLYECDRFVIKEMRNVLLGIDWNRCCRFVGG